MKFLTFALIVVLCFSFRKEPSKAMKAFREWYTDHADTLHQQVEADHLSYQIDYLPKELTVVREIMNLPKVSSSLLEELNSKYDAVEEYSFRITTSKGRDLLLTESEDKEDYQRKLFYLIENIQFDFALVQDQDTLYPLRCDFENNYGNAPSIKLHLVFDKTKKGGKQKELYYLDQLFGNGMIRYDLTHITNLNIPKIK